MKISFVTYGNITQHATLKRATGMAPVLSDMGFDVSILLENCPDNLERVRLECPDVTIYCHKHSNSAWKERADKVRQLNSVSPDIVWICGVGIRNWILPGKTTPVVLGDHSELLSAIDSRNRLRRCWDSSNEWLHLPSFSGHICASRYLERLYKKRNRFLRLNRPVHYSPYAYNAELLESEPLILGDLKKRYGDCKNILYMGSFWENYGFWDMLNAFRELLSERNDFRVLMMGKGPEKEAGIAWLKNENLSDRIKILGYISEEELSSYFHLADAFVCPLRDTIQDQARCPSKLFMYLPFKKPIITCPIGEAAEIFGDAGFYYKPGNREELANSLRTVLDLNDWQSTVDEKQHNWTARGRAFVAWLRENEKNLGL